MNFYNIELKLMSVEIHVGEEISKEDPCDFMSVKHIERKEYIEIKEKQRAEEKERLAEELYVFDSISILLRESEHFECSKEKESDHVKGIENKGRRMEKELRNFYGDKQISLFLNPFSLCDEFSLGELEMLLVAYTSHISIFGELCAISFYGNLFLLVLCMLKCLTPCVSLENQLVPNVLKYLSSHASFVNHFSPSKAKIDRLLFEHENLHDDYFMKPKVVESWLASAIFDVLHARIEGKPIEKNDYALTFFATFMKNFDGFILSNKTFSPLSEQIEFLSIKHVLSLFKDFAWHVLEEQRKVLRGAKTLLLSKVQVEQTKETSLEDFEATNSKEEEDLTPTTCYKVYPTVHGRFQLMEEKMEQDLPLTAHWQQRKPRLKPTNGSRLPLPPTVHLPYTVALGIPVSFHKHHVFGVVVVDTGACKCFLGESRGKSTKEKGVIVQGESCTEEKRRLSGESDEEDVGAVEDIEKKKLATALCKLKVPFPNALV
ncbi:hypothetical protein M9H77_06971 [Catharanthus roseus]|uniref:Uncharacterized protein n=1 Tax=Catharanthus roseus TaxID=4058 RepID=A0ACC0BTL4_CATRO|nr:hypothetical protein M9H77_06971 [Catharanthus roseus]